MNGEITGVNGLNIPTPPMSDMVLTSTPGNSAEWQVLPSDSMVTTTSQPVGNLVINTQFGDAFREALMTSQLTDMDFQPMFDRLMAQYLLNNTPTPPLFDL